MILLQVPKLSFDSEIAVAVITPWLVMGISAIVVLIVAKLANFSRQVTGALLLVAVLGNTSFLGIPIVQNYYGSQALGYVVVYDQLGTFLALATYGSLIVAIYTGDKSPSLQNIVTKILTFPPFIALIVALALIGKEFVTPIATFLQLLSMTIVPLALFAIGLQLKLKLPKPYFTPFAIALSIKLVLAPLVALLLMFILGYNSLVAKVSILESAMGPMITAAAVATTANLAPRLSVAIVGYGTLFTLITTGIWYLIIETFL